MTREGFGGFGRIVGYDQRGCSGRTDEGSYPNRTKTPAPWVLPQR